MPVFSRVLRRAYVALAELTWSAVLLILVAHFLVSWLLLALAGESALTDDAVGFVYYYMVTATTVGYGDLSPSSDAGRLITALWVLPGAIAIFTATLGKLLSGVSQVWRRNMKGLGDYRGREGHLVVLGWQDGTSRTLLELVADERTPDEPLPILIAKSIDDNPMPGEIDFVKAQRLADPQALERAGARGARSIVVRGENDDETLAAALVATTVCPSSHVVAHFEYQATADILSRQAARVETITSLSSELLVRSARDPGSSKVAKLLLSAASADTAYSIRVPEGTQPLTYEQALHGLRKAYHATLVGIGKDGTVDLNCLDDVTISSGDTLYYISDHRLDGASFDWSRLNGAPR